MPTPLPLSAKVTPVGSAPVSVRVGVGVPAVVTEKVLVVPTVNVVLLALVITGPAFPGFTVSVKAWVAAVPGTYQYKSLMNPSMAGEITIVVSGPTSP